MEHLSPTDPQEIGGYRLLARLGAGGMGQVFLARSERGRTVAVKLVRRDLAQHPDFRARFRQEVAVARRVAGEWTAPVLDADTEAEVPWLATGYVAGPSLQAVVANNYGPLPERSVRILTAGLAYALQDIHAAGLIHRDLKPSNVLVTLDGPRVIDFGIARALEDGGAADTSILSSHTRTGELIGSPGFMAPEQLRGEAVTTACDVFCLGSLLAYAAGGTLPFGDTDSEGGAAALLLRIAESEPDLSRVPASLRDLVRSCLAKDPAARPTPGDLLALVGAQDTVADGRSIEPWLPVALVAQLGRHAVELLDREDSGPARPSPAAADPNAASSAHARPSQAPPLLSPLLSSNPVDPQRTPSSHDDAHGAAASTGPGPAAPLPPSRPGAAVYGVRTGHPTSPPPFGPASPSSPPAPTTPFTAPMASPYPSPPSGGHAAAPHLAGTTPASYGPYGPWPGPASSYGYGPPVGYEDRPRRTLPSVLLVVLAVVVALLAGGSVYAFMHSTGDPEVRGPGPTASVGTDGKGMAGDSAGSEGTTGTGGSPSSLSPSPSTPGRLPAGYAGTWYATSETGSWQLALSPGEVGSTVMVLSVTGTDFRCTWSATLRTAGPPVELAPSSVSSGDPARCSPGQWSRLTLRSETTLERELVGSGKAPLVYTKGS